MLGYGITIHKAQGMTLENLFVHCKGIFKAGQLSVGIGRAVTSVGLFLSDYRKGLCPQPKVTQFPLQYHVSIYTNSNEHN